MNEDARIPDGVVVRGPGGGRSYPCGSMQALFRADGEETGDRYSVSEWWLDPGSEGVHPHLHEENDEVFLVLEGTVTFTVGNAVVEGDRGAFLRIPPGVLHGFRNDTDERAGVLNLFVPGGFEERMPSIVEWYAQQPRP